MVAIRNIITNISERNLKKTYYRRLVEVLDQIPKDLLERQEILEMVVKTAKV